MTERAFVFGVDLDGVVADFYGGLRPIAAEWLGVALESLPERVSWGLVEWGVAQAPGGYDALHKFAVMQRELFLKLPPTARAPQALRRLSKAGVRIRIITHRLFIKYFHQIAVSQTIQWLDRHDIPYWDLCFMQEKTAVGADLYIEDSPTNIERLRADGAKTIVFTNSTNEHLPGPRAGTWNEVAEMVLAEKEEWERRAVAVAVTAVSPVAGAGRDLLVFVCTDKIVACWTVRRFANQLVPLKDLIMRLLVFVMLVVVSSPVVCRADNWPQWMGPKRDNVWREDGLVEKFPEGGPRVAWRVPVAGGYAGPAVVGDKVFVTDYVTDANVKIDNFDRKEFTGIERVLCLDEATGKQRWHHDYPVKYTISYPAGPRCTPVVEGDRLYTLGSEGNLICFKADSGDIVWQKDLPKEYQTKTALWGYAGHPLIDGEKLICIAGGEGSHAVALNKNTGDEIWRSSSSPEQGYSPPTIIKVGDKRQLLLARPSALSAVDPETGREYWSVPYEATSGSIIMSPVHSGKYVYLGGYAKKSLLTAIADDGLSAEVVWRDKMQHGISPINVQPFVTEEVMYGFDQNGMLYAVELPSGKRIWETSQPVSKRPATNGTAFIVRQGDNSDRYWLFNDSGDLIIARLSLKGYEEIDRTHLIEPTNTAFGRDVVWCMPAFANKRMYVRNDSECICVELAK